jgi:glycosyltransferase involved in cell wall biosynthesis
LARDLGVEDNLLLTGWLDQRDVPSLIAAADVGLIPHLVSEHTDTTVPNKIFDYMAQGRPVVVTQCRTLREIVESCQCGVVYADRDPEALASAVRTLADPATRERLGRAGRRAIQERYRWDKDAAVLLTALDAFAGDRRASTRSLAQA